MSRTRAYAVQDPRAPRNTFFATITLRTFTGNTLKDTDGRMVAADLKTGTLYVK